MSTTKAAAALAFSAAVLMIPAHAALLINQLGSGGLDAQGLANTLIGGNSGIAISNVQFIGDNVQGATFNNGGSAGLGINSGIVLSSGNVNDLPLSGISFGAGQGTAVGTAGDASLSGIVGTETHDAAVLKFDFVPNGDTVQFSYVFGSTEYNEFVDSEFNDVFAFLVNGANVALIPGTSTPVAINTVNCGMSDAAAPGSGANCNHFIDNRNTDSSVGKNLGINLGGFTQTFSFTAGVTANVKNTMYIAIADTSDSVLDSAVLIAGGTFSTCGGPDQPVCGVVPEPNIFVFLGCAAGAFLFLRRWRSTAH
jgi:hypothetical protein